MNVMIPNVNSITGSITVVAEGGIIRWLLDMLKSFSDGDARKWFQRFEICATANQWDGAKKALKLPTLLESEALAIWLELLTE